MSSILVRHLNFLEEKGRSTKEVFSLNYLWIVVILITFVASAAGYFYYQKSQVSWMRTQVENTTQEVTQLRNAELSTRANVDDTQLLKDVLGSPIVWSEMVKKTINKIPDSIKIIQLSGMINNKRTLLIRGTSSFLTPIFRLKDSLAALPECTKTSLVSVEQMPGDSGSEQLSFFLECTLL